MDSFGGRDEEARFGVEDGGERRSGGGVYGGNGVLVDGIRGPDGNVTVTNGVIGLVNGAATRRSLSRDTEPSTEDVDASKPLPWVGPEETWYSPQPIRTADLFNEMAAGDGSAGTVAVFNGLGDGGEVLERASRCCLRRTWMMGFGSGMGRLIWSSLRRGIGSKRRLIDCRSIAKRNDIVLLASLSFPCPEPCGEVMRGCWGTGSTVL
jgi:hypothetical protein